MKLISQCSVSNIKVCLKKNQSDKFNDVNDFQSKTPLSEKLIDEKFVHLTHVAHFSTLDGFGLADCKPKIIKTVSRISLPDELTLETREFMENLIKKANDICEPTD
mmetsp:Transcript_2359/g.3426  ORF Transcript_2359/g.3426 Transcript_2359/m.3426 type:complete len:106 (+) Transcript_2359:327-644(+)